jgi:hypothetical protein
VFIDESEGFVDRLPDFLSGEGDRFSRVARTFSNLPLEGGESEQAIASFSISLGRGMLTETPPPVGTR